MFCLVIASVRDRADFHRITYETLQQAAEHGVRHREMFWNPTTHMACGVPYETARERACATHNEQSTRRQRADRPTSGDGNFQNCARNAAILFLALMKAQKRKES